MVRKNSQNSVYFSFYTTIIIYFSIFIVLLIMGLYSLVKLTNFKNEEVINYNEKSLVDYKVKLKENDYYETNILDKNMIYVSSLIDSIDASFKYDFEIDKKSNVEFTYNIIGILEVTDESGEKKYLQKDYKLVDDKTAYLTNEKSFGIREQVSINYEEYNQIATSFKSTYAVASKSNLIVLLQINKHSKNDKVRINESITKQKITIPLSERGISIKLDYKDINKDSTIINESNFCFSNLIGLIVSQFIILISLVFLYKTLKEASKLIPKTNPYDRFINKALKEYNRLIVETYTKIDFSKYEVIKVKNFDELLDVHDNLNSPINYYEVVPHFKAYFYIATDKVYLYVAKIADFEKHKGKS